MSEVSHNPMVSDQQKSTEVQAESTTNVNAKTFRSYGYRWVILSIFCSLDAANAVLYAAFIPISNIAENYFDGSAYNNATAINMFATVFLVLYPLGSLMGALSLKYVGLRNTMILAGLLNVVGALLRYIGALSRGSSDSNDDDTISSGNGSADTAYAIMLLGQSIAALAFPIIVNLPAAIAALWFPVEERDLSTTIGALFNPIGNALGQLLPALIVTQSQPSTPVAVTAAGPTYSSVFETSATATKNFMENIHSSVRELAQRCFTSNRGAVAKAAVLIGNTVATEAGSEFYYRDGIKLDNGASSTLRKLSVDDDDHDTVHGMATLMLVEFVMCLLPLLLAILLFKDAPPTPPSSSTSMKQENELLRRQERKKKKQLVETSSSSSSGFDSTNDSGIGNNNSGICAYIQNAMSSVTGETAVLFADRNYCLLLAAFSLMIGILQAFVAMCNQVLQPHGYSNAEAGTLSAVCIVAGLIASVFMGAAMKRTKAYRTLLKIGGLAVFFSSVLFFCLLRGGAVVPLLLSGCLLGCTALPLLPLMMETAAETTYPVAEELSTGLMHNGANLLGVVFIFTIQGLLELEALGPPPLLPSSLFVMGVIGAFAIIALLYNGKYKRLELDTEAGQSTTHVKTPLLEDDESIIQ